MPWEEKVIMDQRLEFVNRALTERISFTELCNEYGISRKTGYKWKERYLENGYSGLYDISRKPISNSNQLSEDTIIQVIQLKNAHPHWGARKIQELLRRSKNINDIPSESSIKRIFDKAGLVNKKRRRKINTSVNTLRNIIQPEQCNDVWTVDFKGWWYSEDRFKCQPLTIRDEKSKYIQDIKLLSSQSTDPVKEVFSEVFRKNGLPLHIRSDNGSPFAAHNSILGITKLSAWWISLGIMPNRIIPGCPYQNGGHERMHLDMKREIQHTKKGTLLYMQNVIDEWVDEYNQIRPHESLGMQTPSEVYTKSTRIYTGDIDEFIYPIGFEQRKVIRTGCIIIQNDRIHISCALQGYYLGLDFTGGNIINVWFGEFLLGKIDLISKSFYPIEEC